MDGFLQMFLTVSMGILAVCMAFSLARSIIGPTITDRMIGVNMINTQIILFLLALSLYLGEGFIMDVALLYAMIGFLSVVVFAKVYIGADLERQAKGEEPVVTLAAVSKEEPQEAPAVPSVETVPEEPEKKSSPKVSGSTKSGYSDEKKRDRKSARKNTKGGR